MPVRGPWRRWPNPPRPLREGRPGDRCADWAPLAELAVPAGCASDGMEGAARPAETLSELTVLACCEGGLGGRRGGHGAAARARDASLRREARPQGRRAGRGAGGRDRSAVQLRERRSGSCRAGRGGAGRARRDRCARCGPEVAARAGSRWSISPSRPAAGATAWRSPRGPWSRCPSSPCPPALRDGSEVAMRAMDHGDAGRARRDGLRREARSRGRRAGVEPLAEIAVPACCGRGGPEIVARAVEALAEPAAPAAGGAARRSPRMLGAAGRPHPAGRRRERRPGGHRTGRGAAVRVHRASLLRGMARRSPRGPRCCCPSS